MNTSTKPGPQAGSDWKSVHEEYAGQPWAKKPSIFLEQVIDHFKPKGYFVEAGCGNGTDTVYLRQQGFRGIGVDLAQNAIDRANALAAERGIAPCCRVSDIGAYLSQQPNKSVDIVYAHLSLQYFSEALTLQIFGHIRRVLKHGGILAALFNTTQDPEISGKTSPERNCYVVDGLFKRYFTQEEVVRFVGVGFEDIILDDKGETYKDAAKGVHGLIRYVGKKLP